MTYDWHGPWDQNPSHHSPLYGPEGAVRIIYYLIRIFLSRIFTTTKKKLTQKNHTLAIYINGGISPSKLNLGLAFYGIKYKILYN